jgi:capsular polysaccharide export protein
MARLRALIGASDEARKIGKAAFPNESERIASAAAEIVRRKVAKADAVAVWNGSRDVALAAVRAARSLGKPVVYVENGFLPGTVQIDLQGVNFESSLAALTPQEVWAMDLPPSAFEAAEHIEYRQRPLGRDTGLADQPEPLPDDLPSEFVLFAAQVHDDSQIVRFSPHFRSIDSAIRYAAEECAAVGLAMVVKEHPSDHGRVDYEPLKASLPDVRFVQKADNAALIQMCGAFVTVNSSMGLQAVDVGKPVFTLGDAAYNLPGIAYRVRPPERLRDVLGKPLFDQDLRRRYLAYLAGVALVSYRSRMPTDEDLRGVMKRMAELLCA